MTDHGSLEAVPKMNRGQTMEEPLVVNSVGSMLKVLQMILRMVHHDMQLEGANGMAVSQGPSTANPYKYNPAEW